MRHSLLWAASYAALFLLQSPATANDLAAASDLDLVERTRDAVEAQDATSALDLLTEMQRRGVGIFAGVEKSSCEEVITLPDAITDWKFRAVARQAYFRTAMSKRLEAGSCSCPFDDFSFDAFVRELLGKTALELTNADRLLLEDIRDDNRREIEARFRRLEQSCRAN